MKVTIDLDKLDFIDIETRERETSDGLNEVTLSCGTVKVSYASDTSIEECTTYAFRLFLKLMSSECNCQQAYNRKVGQSTII